MNPQAEDAYILPCCIEGPEFFRTPAQYALRMLLYPLGITPVWVSSDELAGGGIYYGPEPAKAPEKALAFLQQADTCRYFEDFKVYQKDRVIWRTIGDSEYPVLFGGPAPENGDLPYNDDLIASTFFWLSGWQEYTIQNRDQHGRFPYADSLQAALGMVTEPAVDQYREVLKRQLLQHNIPLKQRTWEGKSWAFCATHDIDYMRKWRPGMIYRETVERLIANSADENFSRRIGRFGQFVADWVRPGDIFRKAFKRMVAEVSRRGGRATYFLKTGAHGPHDVYYPTNLSFLKRMLVELKAKGFEIGLHPSYYAHAHAGYMAEEKEALEKALGHSVTAIRQHYLRYTLPHTPRLQEAAGFRIDSTLAFAEHEGFRNGTCFPFLRYDIPQHRITAVWEIPLCFMDGSLFNYRKLSLDEAIQVSRQLIKTCKKYGGVCVGLWHNTLWDEMDFPGWGAHFEAILDTVVAEDGAMLPLGDLGQVVNIFNHNATLNLEP